MLFIIFGVFIGIILLLIKRKLGIPYTPMLLGVGILIGYFNEHLWKIGESMEYVVGLSSHTLLLVFIPPLIFESAFSADFFTLS